MSWKDKKRVTDGEDDVAPAEPAPRRQRSRRRKAALIASGTLAGLLSIIWTQRVAIGDQIIRQQLEQRGIPASYKIQTIGLGIQRMTDMVIGDPEHPDLTANLLELTLDWGWSGPIIREIKADGVRLVGRYQQGVLSFGYLDKFSDPASKEPFTLPDFQLQLSDARASIVTPWGNFGAAVTGKGHLRRGFDGKLALVAPKLTEAGCVADDGRFYGDVRVRGAQPKLVGPLRFAAMTCADSDFSIRSPKLALDARLSENFAQWQGTAGLDTGTVKAGNISVQGAKFSSEFAGRSRATRWSLAGQAVQFLSPQARAQTIGLKLRGDIGSGKQMFDGELEFEHGFASTALRKAVVSAADGFDGTPLGPLVTKAGRSMAAALADISGVVKIGFAGDPSGQDIVVRDFALSAASGALLSSRPDSELVYARTAEGAYWTAHGQWALIGGGLPNARVEMDRRANAQFRGRVELRPYSAGQAQIAMDPLDIAGNGAGDVRFRTSVRVSGPLADGRVDDAVVPLAGRWNDRGILALDGGCHAVRARQMVVGGYRLDQPHAQICSAAGRDLLTYGPRGLTGEVIVPRLALQGRSADGGISVQMGRGNFDLGGGSWAVHNAAVQLTSAPSADGEAVAPTHFSVERLEGQLGSRDMAGNLSGAEGRIGAVPLNMSEIEGAWRWRDGALTIGGQLLLTDANADARFAPLIARDARLRFANGRISAQAAFQERKSGRRVVEADIAHRFDGSGGDAKLYVAELRFDEGFQPDQLTRLALGVVAEVDAAIVGDGFVRWNKAGVTSGGTFATANANLAAAFGPVTGLTGAIIFDDLLDLKTKAGQKLTIREVNPGISVFDGEMEYELLGNNRVRIEGGKWPLAGGELSLHPTTLNFAAEETRHLVFDMIGIDAANFLQRFGFDNLNVTGIFDGSLPVEFDGLGGRVVDGRVDSRAGGGKVEYVGELSNRNLGAMANFAFGALRSLTYDDLSIVLNGALDGEMVTDIRFGGVGQGESATRNFLTQQIARIPMIFNVKVSAPFRSLFTTVKGLYDPSVQIEQKLPELIRQQSEAEERILEQGETVQPLASEPVQ